MIMGYYDIIVEELELGTRRLESGDFRILDDEEKKGEGQEGETVVVVAS